jgi:hypothetical protein
MPLNRPLETQSGLAGLRLQSRRAKVRRCVDFGTSNRLYLVVKGIRVRPFAILLSVLSSTVALSAQTPVNSTGSTGAVIGAMPGNIISNSPWFVSSSRMGTPGGVVAGAPYCAEQITEHVQTLADGTHITQPAQMTKLYRDSQGRTRTERSAPLPPGPLGNGVNAPVFIEISDPVGGVRYTLETQNHTAHRMSIPVTLRPPAPPPTNATGPSAARTIQLLPGRVAPQSASTPPDQSLRPQISRESLGTQTIEGVLAEGSRTTVTYPVGAIGNDRPITTITETWTSPELKMVILSKDSDPRNGESTTRLTNVTRAEPDPSLFQIPADYEIIDPQAVVKQ